ncbi:unnamed protein product [Prunus armeniaca]|uniref:RING-type E3 ubiquitin transferase n=1 Tax=Prunus armeniaca TaxID=36596 RepID=A0A6J5XD75_PRUAR|nr:unnamed protein product [Prunus armeniaca]
MATLEIFTLLFFLFFFLPHTPARATTCPRSKCTAGSPSVRFPFRISNLQPSRCGYQGFDLLCNKESQTILTLPSSGDFIVQTISYKDQIVSINDPDNCLPKRFLDHDITLKDSPFIYAHGLETYMFLNCSAAAAAAATWTFAPISCLSNENYKVIAAPTSLWPGNVSGQCVVISTALVPSLFDPLQGVQLRWLEPECLSCEAAGLYCGFDSASSQIKCLDPSDYFSSGLSRVAKFGIIISMGVPGLLCIVGIALCFCDLISAGSRSHQPIAEHSTVSNREPHMLRMGLDGQTIESYPKTQLGESLELPEPKDNTCPICLGEYKAKAILRTIPGCSHYFHASCIDEWLRLNATCPICRNQSNEQ